MIKKIPLNRVLCTCYFIYIYIYIYLFVHAPLRKVKLILLSRASTTLIKKIEALGQVPERPINPNPGLKFCSTFCIYLPMHCFKVTYFVIIPISRRKGSTVCCKLQLHVLRLENLA